MNEFKNTSKLQINHTRNNMNDVDNNDIENGDDLFIWLEGTNEENLENLWSRDTPDEADESELKISHIENNTTDVDNSNLG